MSAKSWYYLVWFCRLWVGILFVISGLIKVNDIIGFSYKLDEYFDVFQQHFGLPAAPFKAVSIPMAAFISIVETVIAFFLLFGYRARFTVITLLATIVFFTFLTGYSWITDSVKDCGCFGDALKLTPFQSFMKDVFLTILIGILFRFHHLIKPILSPKPNLIAVSSATALVTGLTAYCFYFLPIIDFLPACEGCDLKETTLDKLGDYSSFGADAGIDEFKGNALLITMGHLEKMPANRKEDIINLHAQLKGKNIQVLGGATSLSDSMKKYAPQYPFPISSQDGVLLKTMVRSNPGFILLKNGVVMRKWSKYEIPDEAEISKYLQ